MKYFILDFKDERGSLSSNGVEALRRATQGEPTGC